MYEEEFSYIDLIGMLKSGDATQRQISALRLSKLKSACDAQVFASNLIGQDGKVREAVSFKLKQFVGETPQYFLSENIYKIFLNAVIDINGNVCRNVISAVSGLKYDLGFVDYFCQNIFELVMPIIKFVEKFDIQDGKYKVNKEVFKLYWYLEAIYEFAEYMPIDYLKEVLSRTRNINEYTIREKTAKILTKNFTDVELLKIKSQLKNDHNYYVRKI